MSTLFSSNFAKSVIIINNCYYCYCYYYYYHCYYYYYYYLCGSGYHGVFLPQGLGSDHDARAQGGFAKLLL